MEVLTTSGFKKVKQLRIGDEVVAVDLKSVNKIEEIKVWTSKNTDKENHGEFTYYHINDNLKFYKEQSIYANGRVVHARELKIGDKIFDHNRSEVVIYSIKKSLSHIWHRFKISGDHSYIVKGAILHNAARFWNKQNGSSTFTITAPTNWGSASGVADGASVPGSADDVTFDGAGVGGNAAGSNGGSITFLSLTFTAGYTQNITLTGTLTIAGNFTDNTAHTWSGSNGLVISAASTITSGGKTFPNTVTFSGANTKTLSGDWTITGALTISAATVINSNTLTIGGLTMSGATSGTTAIALTGGTWSGGSVLQNNMTITGTVTISSSVAYNTGTLTCTSATVTTTGSTLNVGASTTINTSSISWNNLTATGATTTLTLNSLLTVNGTLLYATNADITFSGISGFTVGTLSWTTTNGFNWILVNSITYIITNSLSAFSSRVGTINMFTSNHATNKAILTLNNGATCNVLASFTRIDASAGRTIWTFNGTVTTCFNIISLTDLSFVTGRLNQFKAASNY